MWLPDGARSAGACAGKAAAVRVSLQQLIFESPRLLEWLGWNIVQRNSLLGTAPCSPLSEACHIEGLHSPLLSYT